MKTTTWASVECVDGHLIKGVVLESTFDVAEFMKDRPDPDQSITWVCPECHTKVGFASFVYETPCPSCRKFKFPRIHTPITGDVSDTIHKAFLRNDIESMKKDIEEAQHTIRNCESEIEEQEQYIEDLTEKIKKYQEAVEMK
jgi:hypothetical protein